MSQTENGRAGVARMCAKCVQNFNENHWRWAGKLLDHVTAAAVRMVRRARELPGTLEVCKCNKLLACFILWQLIRCLENSPISV